MPEDSKVYPMTIEQESIWLDDHMSGGPSQYLESWVLQLIGDINREAVEWALGQIVARHEALRTAFIMVEDRLLQVVHAAQAAPRLARRTCSPAALDDELRSLVQEPMELAEVAMRATLVDLAPDNAILVLQVHHVVLDDWALHTLEKEFEEHYRAYVEGRPAARARVPLQPGEYATVQRSSPADPQVLAYWRENLRDLPTDVGKTVPSVKTVTATTHYGARIAVTLDAKQTKQIRAVCRRLRVTPFAVFTATAALLLHAANNCAEAIVGTPVSRRGTADHDQMVAPHSELLPLRLKTRAGQSFVELVLDAKSKTHEAIKYREALYRDLIKLTRKRGEPGTGRLCRTVIVVDEAEDFRMDIPGVLARRLYVESGFCKFDLFFTFLARDGQYAGTLEYATDLFSASEAQRVAESFGAFLTAATGDVDSSLSALANGIRGGGQP